MSTTDERTDGPVEVDPVEARIRELVAEAPPLCSSQRSRLRVLLSGAGEPADRQRAAA
ncbi:hypothetical protein [Pseudonocardia sp. NPDC049635]|uniref:hypothetical protein n=1 Tax=Pseudonocardia sp. NPDC049635 TaxID=3155506 RepID=UPI0034096B8E